MFDCLDPHLDPQGYFCLEASAGTGKTFAIEHLVARLLLKKVPINEILVVTFTRAATRDLKKRIRHNLETLFSFPPPYIQALDLEKKPKAKRLIEEALFCFDQTQIFTIHAFCQKMLTTFAFEAKVDFDLFSMEKEGMHLKLRKEIEYHLQYFLSEENYHTNQLHVLLKNCQYDKEILIDKILFFLQQEGKFPLGLEYHQLIQKFEKIKHKLPKISKETYLSLAPAFKGICDRKGQLKQTFKKQVDSLSHLHCFASLLKETPSLLSYFKEENRSKKGGTFENVKLLYTLRNQLLPLIEEGSDPKRLLMRLSKEIQKKISLKKEFTSPNDLLKVMEKSLEIPPFLEKIQNNYQAVIIDEFQDTDPRQWNIFKKLFLKPKLQAFYLVGDPKQSIYGFRNADLKTYFKAKKFMDYHFDLNINYRSEKTLLSQLNALFLLNKNFPYKKVFPASHAEDSVFSDHLSPLHFFAFDEKENLSSHLAEKHYFFPFIANEIQKLVQKKEAKFKDIAILVKDRHQAFRLKKYLEKLNINATSKNSKPLRNSSLFSLFEAFLKALIDPRLAKLVLSHPLIGLTHHHIKNEEGLKVKATAFFYHLQHLFKKKGLEKAIEAFLNASWLPRPSHQSLQKPQTPTSNVYPLSTPSRSSSKAHETYKLKNDSLLEKLVKRNHLEYYSDFMQFTTILIEKSFKEHTTLTELLFFLRHLPNDEIKYHCSIIHDLNAVSIMTIHMSKGLEFPIVFSLGTLSRYKKTPSFLRHDQTWVFFEEKNKICQEALLKAQEEKKREFYVALTRAKKRLYVAALIQKKQKKCLPNQLSSFELFFQDLPPLEKVAYQIGATLTYLEKREAIPLKENSLQLFPPKKICFKKSKFQIDSFSSLSKKEAFDFAEIENHELPRGTQTGILLHFLLEKIIREKINCPYDLKKIKNLVAKSTIYSPLKPWEKEIITLIDAAFHISLDGFCLKEVSSDYLYPETEFLFSLTPHQGLKGFIDLIVFQKGIYYLIDWKTNQLSDYSDYTLKETVEKMDYFLQAKIYIEALQRYLYFKKDAHSIKGIYYIFLRGLKKKEGVCFIPFNHRKLGINPMETVES